MLTAISTNNASSCVHGTCDSTGVCQCNVKWFGKFCEVSCAIPNPRCALHSFTAGVAVCQEYWTERRSMFLAYSITFAIVSVGLLFFSSDRFAMVSSVSVTTLFQAHAF